jgi:hypothetical protein
VDSQRIVVTTTPSFAVSWLVERLAEFARAHPRIEIAIEAGNKSSIGDPTRSICIGTAWEYLGRPHWLMAPADRHGSPHSQAARRSPKPKIVSGIHRFTTLSKGPNTAHGTRAQRDVPGWPCSMIRYWPAALADRPGGVRYHAASDIAAGRLVQPFGKMAQQARLLSVGRAQTFATLPRRFKTWLIEVHRKRPEVPACC